MSFFDISLQSRELGTESRKRRTKKEHCGQRSTRKSAREARREKAEPFVQAIWLHVHVLLFGIGIEQALVLLLGCDGHIYDPNKDIFSQACVKNPK